MKIILKMIRFFLLKHQLFFYEKTYKKIILEKNINLLEFLLKIVLILNLKKTHILKRN